MGAFVLTRTSNPAKEPLSLDEVKSHLRITDNESDSELVALIQEARIFVEEQTGKSLITQTWQWRLDGFKRELKVPRPPLQSITSITYIDSNNVAQILSSSVYTVDAKSMPGRLVEATNSSYPSTYATPNAVTITFTSGYGTNQSDVPEVYKRIMKLYIEQMFDMPYGLYAESLSSALISLLDGQRLNWL